MTHTKSYAKLIDTVRELGGDVDTMTAFAECVITAYQAAQPAPVHPVALHRDLHSHLMVVAHRAVDLASSNGQKAVSQKEIVRAICKAIQTDKNLLAKLTPPAAPVQDYKNRAAAIPARGNA
jgi:hypothetical protein